jgi:serine/threonine protein kinase
LKKEYKLTQILGQGTSGVVIKGYNRQTAQVVAIKRIECNFKKMFKMKYVLREISILRQLTSLKTIFSPILYDVIIPENEINDPT